MDSKLKSGVGGLVVKSQFRGCRVPGPKPNIAEDLPSMRAWCMLNRPPAGMERKFGEERQAQVLLSFSYHSSKLRGPFQNGLRVDSRRDVNITN
ncbi:hypothetical protein AVEN_53355-1 [Araneus ventricosus]|uniref:Uncharacterized protein n=1 Tax=Araneus ventricosus TaxID=182803 RepID=A0A4Y2AAQ2_ARAVE|nr:hypothetical protein AVEN_53355-1 [Araneus ventricosus]